MISSEAHPTLAPADTTFLPGPVLLLGAPGVGKGTQAQILMAEFGVPQISTGDLFRDHRTRHTKLGMLAEKVMSQGQLVGDDLVNEMVADRLTEPDAQRGYILDGFPRTLPQAAWLDHHLGESHSTLPVVAISITVDYNVLLHRITGPPHLPRMQEHLQYFLESPEGGGHLRSRRRPRSSSARTTPKRSLQSA